MVRFILSLIVATILIFNPYPSYSSQATNPSAISLRNRISNNFSNKFCKGIDSGFSKDQAMRSAIIETEKIVAFSLNPQKKYIIKDDLANQISIKVINKCGLTFGLTGKEGINYFKRYFLEINEKTTPNKKLSGWLQTMNNISDKNIIIIILMTIFFIFLLIFSVKSPERKVIDSPIIWKENYIQSSNNQNIEVIKIINT